MELARSASRTFHDKVIQLVEGWIAEIEMEATVARDDIMDTLPQRERIHWERRVDNACTSLQPDAPLRAPESGSYGRPPHHPTLRHHRGKGRGKRTY
jgi:hypothetical protein